MIERATRMLTLLVLVLVVAALYVVSRLAFPDLWSRFSIDGPQSLPRLGRRGADHRAGGNIAAALTPRPLLWSISPATCCG